MFDFLKGGKQGGVDTPDLFNVVVEYLLENLIESWTRRKYGVVYAEASGTHSEKRVNHLIWCDNIWILADDRDSLQIMITDLTAAIHAGGFTWKPSSSQVMGAGDVAEIGPDSINI